MTKGVGVRWAGVLATGLVLISTIATIANRDYWPGNVASWFLIVPIVLTAIAGMLHIGLGWAWEAIVLAADDSRAPTRRPMARPVLWLPILAVIVWPLYPMYLTVTKQQSDTEMSFIGMFVAALIVAAAWIALRWRLTSEKPTRPTPPQRRTLLRVLVPFSALLALLSGFIVFAPAVSAQEGVVVRVVDGDTVDVRVAGGVRRVRVLNIDTPETVDPNGVPECLGEEATAFTESKLAPGSSIDLKYDKERKDRYGRTLAHVVLADGHLLSTEIAKAGLGVPTVVGTNNARIDEVNRGLEVAEQLKVGFFDPAKQCTFAAQLVSVKKSQTEALAAGAGTTAAEAAAAAAAVTTMWTSYRATRAAVRTSTTLAVKAFISVGAMSSLKQFQRALDAIEKRADRLTKISEKRRVKEKAAAKKAAKAAAAKKAAEKAAKKAAKKAREAAKRAADRAEAARESAQAPDLSNYTGPRCYAPGGRSWKPC